MYSYQIKYVDTTRVVTNACLSQELTQAAPASSLGILPTFGETSAVTITTNANSLTLTNPPTFPVIPTYEKETSSTYMPTIRWYYSYNGVALGNDCSLNTAFSLFTAAGNQSEKTITLNGIGASYIISNTITIDSTGATCEILTSYGSNESKITKINLDAVDTSLPKDFTTVAQ